MTNPPDLPVSKSRSAPSAASIVWLVPLAALVIAMGIAWQSYSNRGPLIEIAFADAAGMNAGEMFGFAWLAGQYIHRHLLVIGTFLRQ